MKYPPACIFMLAATIFGYVQHGLADDPPQQTCHTLKALRRPKDVGSASQGVSWRVARVTRMPNPENEHRFGPNENFCSVAHYGPHCGAVHYTKLLTNDGNTMATALCYNSHTKDILRYYKVLYPMDPNYLISQGTTVKMERISKDNDITPVKTIPKSLLEDHGAMYAVIAAAPDGKWTISRTCDLKITWVLFPGELPGSSEEFMRAREAEIDEKLKELGVDKSTMANVPLSLPFQPPAPRDEKEIDDLSKELDALVSSLKKLSIDSAEGSEVKKSTSVTQVDPSTSIRTDGKSVDIDGDKSEAQDSTLQKPK